MGDTGANMGSRAGLHSQCVIVGEILLGTLDHVRQELIDSGELGEYEDAAVETGRRQVIEYLVTLHYRNRLEKGQVSVTVIKEEQSPVREQHSDWSPATDPHGINSRRKRKGTTTSSKDEPVSKNLRQDLETSEVSENEGFSDRYSTSDDDDFDNGNYTKVKSTSKNSSRSTAEVRGKLGKPLVQRKPTSNKRRKKKVKSLKEADAKQMSEKQEKKLAEVKKRLEQEVVDEAVSAPGKVTCPVCSRQVKEESLETHIRFNHSGTKRTCEQCGKQYSSRTGLTRHWMTCVYNHSFCCRMCDFTAQTEEALLAHKIASHGEPAFACTQCDKSFLHRSSLRNHVNANHGKQRFRCRHCGSDFPCRRNLQIHTTEKHKGREYICFCGKQYSSRSSLRFHQQRNHEGRKQPTPGELEAASQSGVSASNNRRTQVRKTLKETKAVAKSKGVGDTELDAGQEDDKQVSEQYSSPYKDHSDPEQIKNSTNTFDCNLVQEEILSERTEYSSIQVQYKVNESTVNTNQNDSSLTNVSSVVSEQHQVNPVPMETITNVSFESTMGQFETQVPGFGSDDLNKPNYVMSENGNESVQNDEATIIFNSGPYI